MLIAHPSSRRLRKHGLHYEGISMSSLTSGVGLVSGLPINDLVNNLMALQRKPITQLQSRLGVFSARRGGLLQVSAQLLSLKNAASRFAQASFFNSSVATSSNESSILTTASSNAAVGDYALTVRSLAARHQLVSRGFSSANQAAVGAGTLTIESSQGQVNRSTRLGLLNGGAGVQPGRIRVTDRAGNATNVDLLGAQTINDVVERINAATGIQANARVDGDHLVIDDVSGGSGTLSVGEVGNGRTAADLGLLQSVSADTLTGARLVYISEGTRLSDLNDGNGVLRRNIANDLNFALASGAVVGFNLSDSIQQSNPLSLLNGGSGVPDGKIRITNRAGASAEVDLTGAQTVQDVIDRVNGAGINVSLTISGSKFVLLDSSVASGETPHGSLKVEDVGGTTAEALGLATSVTANRLEGRNIYSVNTIGDVLRIINSSPQNRNPVDGTQLLTASISADGLGIQITDHTAGSGSLIVGESAIARDLGLSLPPSGTNAPPVTAVASRPLLAGLNTVLLRSLNGGRGVNLTDLRIGDRNGGALVTVDVSSARTLDDVISAINSAGTGVRAAVSANGLGIDITDNSGGSGNLRITGATAQSLGIAVDAAIVTHRGGNLQKQYVSEATLRAQFNQGAGIPSGRFRIADSTGASAIVDLTGGEATLGDIISEINSRGIGVKAQINDSGDGLILIDTAGGAGVIRVSEEGGGVAKALGLLGEGTSTRNYIDGSFEKRIEVDGNDTLEDVLARIRASGAPVTASIINDGSGDLSYRLNIVSARTGLVGALAIDGGTTQLSFDVLSQARDAVVVVGEAAADRPLVITSGSNTIENVIAGVKLDLVAASETPVNISVRRDDAKILEQARTLIDAFNNVVSTLDSLTSFNPETTARGVLQGDATARRVKQSLGSLALSSVRELDGGINRLGSIGIRINSSGKLELDESKFSETLVANPEAVADLFTRETVDAEGKKTVVGLAGVIQREIDRLTDVENGIITLQEESLQTSETQINRRIQQLNTLLESKRERLLAQFQNMESIIAKLQGQQSALSALVGQISA